MKKKEIIFIILALLTFQLYFCNSRTTNENVETESQDSISTNLDATLGEEEEVSESQLFDSREREKWQNPTLVLRKLGSLENKKIADIGSGTGYFTFPLALRAKKVIAIDIESKFLDYIEEQKVDYPPRIANVIETRLTEEDDPSLHNGEVDIAFMVNVYSYLQNRIEYLKKVKNGLNNGGIILIVDFKKGNLPIGPTDEYKIQPDQVVKELKEAGFKIEEKDTDSLQYQYIIKASKP